MADRIKTHDIRIRVSETEFQELKAYAKKREMTVAELIRYVTRLYRETDENKEK